MMLMEASQCGSISWCEMSLMLMQAAKLLATHACFTRYYYQVE
jgi:hypothetical protein